MKPASTALFLMAFFLAGCSAVDRLNEAVTSTRSNLANAALTGNLRTLQAILDNPSRRISETDKGEALLAAASAGQRQSAALLLERHANRNYTDQRGVTPVFEATARGDSEMLLLLLKSGASPNCQIQTNEGLITPLSVAAGRGNVELVRLLLSMNAEVTSTAIRAAESYGNLGVASLLKKAAEKQTNQFLTESVGTLQKVQAPISNSQGSESSDVDSPTYKGVPREDDFAVVIGIEEYKNLPRASHAAQDASAVQKHFSALGIPERNIIYLINENAGLSSLVKYLDEWLPRNVKPSSRVYFYYSGHGAPDPKSGQAFLVPWDGDSMFLQSTAYPVKQLYSRLAKLRSKQVLVALDACFSGAGGRSVLSKGARPLVTLAEDIQPTSSIAVLTAASGGEITGTLDSQNHGMFTYYLLKGLAEGKRSSRALFDYLKPQVQDGARRQNREQTPMFFGTDVSF